MATFLMFPTGSSEWRMHGVDVRSCIKDIDGCTHGCNYNRIVEKHFVGYFCRERNFWLSIDEVLLFRD